MIRVLLVDDQQLFLESLKIVLETSSEDIEVVASANNGADAIETITEHAVDVVLLDVRMPTMDGVQTVRAIREITLEPKIVMLTTFDDDQYVFEAIRNGASGYLLKDIGAEELVTSIRAVHRGIASISPQLLEKIARVGSGADGTPTWSSRSEAAQADRELIEMIEQILDSLTRQERRILQMIGEGRDNFDIAAELNLAPQTVKNYVSGIYFKLGSHKRGQIARAARAYFSAAP